MFWGKKARKCDSGVTNTVTSAWVCQHPETTTLQEINSPVHLSGIVTLKATALLPPPHSHSMLALPQQRTWGQRAGSAALLSVAPLTNSVCLGG